MNSVNSDELEKYLAEARSWETSKVREMELSRKTAWRIAAVSGTVAVLAVAALAALVPLKHVEPFVVRVDSATGIVDIVEGIADGKTTYEEAVNKYFTQWYIRYREGYSRDLAEEYYVNVGIMSSGLEQQKYAAWFDPKNPLSPLNLYGSNAKVKIRIKSTSFIRSDVALVRYTKEIERGADKPEVSHWAATVVFQYSGAPMSEKDRGINPLGYQVVEYRNDPDVVPAEETLPNPYKPTDTGLPALPSNAVLPVNPLPVVPAIEPEPED